MTEGRLLDLGCGSRRLPGAIGMDLRMVPGVHVVCDLNLAPWPLKALQFSRIHCQHVIEHIQRLEDFLKELYRVSKHGAVVQFITPHYSCYKSWINPYHTHHFAVGSIPQLFQLVLGEGKFLVIKKEIKFSGAVIEFFGWLIYKISPKHYEKHFAWIWPATEVHTTIKIIKQ